MYSKCETCKHKDSQSSNDFLVCPVIPMEVILLQTSKDCKNYEVQTEKNSKGKTNQG